ncbi:RagB/SusD family nutrient uptake outer membrane protein [Sphingobacterium yanglingense]|uniref:Putative outer membrane starch-binding protein n=1 Tax=Sphingobacterium yanglingense TaxID=1437280 RepID=A0A4R6WMU7_9SPHI|nr:RagB/SusD family nutrient uptake outer membrane protein [Sphingobacterium yanglingense]TDQ80168.1 putative outer membrane starch-binding protein [Sphingobacterium yanglingense]
MKFSINLYFIIAILFCSCDFNGYLDKAETGGLTEDEVFGDYIQTERFLANIYGDLANDWMPANSFTYAAASDEAKCPVIYFNGPQVYTRGLLSPTYNPIDNWNALYASIRKVNRFINKIDQIPTVNSVQRDGKVRMKGEAHFLRAYFYLELFKRYGQVPLIDRVLQISDDLSLPRNTVDEVVAFIVGDCEAAIPLLPVVHSSNNLGRATKGASLMLKARTYLLAASPLHNPTDDQSKWQMAAHAAKEIMDLNVYDVDADYSGLFHKRSAKNLIFQSNFNNDGWVKNMFIPSMHGVAWIQPLQNLVDAYEMKNGLSIQEAGSGYDINNPYVGRDPRFYLSILYNGSTWKGETVQTYVGGLDGLTSAEGSLTQTGYYLRKLIDENAAVAPDYRAGDHYWIYMRYEDVLLMYAEAANEALAAPDDATHAAINRVRSRVGMPNLPPNLDKIQMRERIRRERQIELAFESSRFWDIRRWKIGEEVMPKAMGMRILKNGATYSYEPFLVENRIYRNTYNLFPIPQPEINKNENMHQNVGYN